MRLHWIVAAILAVAPAAPSFAQQPQPDMRKQAEQMTATFSERYNKQDTAAIAGMFTKDAVRVSSADGATSTGPQAIAESFKTQFKLGFNHIDLIVDQVSPLGADAAVTVGRYQTTGRGQGGLLRVEGHWTQVQVREAGAWKIRLLTVAPSAEANALTPRTEAAAVSAPRAEPTAPSAQRAEAAVANAPRVEPVAASVSRTEPVAANTPRAETPAANTPRAEAVAANAPHVDSAAMNGPRKEAAAVNVVRVEPVAASVPRADGVPASTPRMEAAATNIGPELKSSVAPTPIPENKKPVIQINIDKSKQRMTVSLDGVEMFDWPVSTGRAGYSTPSGSYTATSMNEIWYSRQWDNAPMPHAVFFMKDGHAIHGSNDVRDLGKPASHGCVRISPENATTLFALVKKSGLENTHVELTGITPGGEYKGAPASVARYSQPVPGTYEAGYGYAAQGYATPRYATQGYATQRTQPAAAVRSSGATRYYAAPQGYYVMPSPYTQQW
jgi:lipoprotein-anchoring transpeptidase ErfK/SrfK/ketosteroid isomerase-like protein